MLELEDVEKGTSRLKAKIRFSERNFKSSKNTFLRGDIIYGKLRPYLDKVLVADEDGVCTTEMIPVRGFKDTDPEFLRLTMKSSAFKLYANNSTHGMNLPRMGTDKARLALIPLAPAPEQHRIVAKVDELMALCDTLEQQQENSIQSHETLVEVLLEALSSAVDADAFQVAWGRISENFDTLFTTDHSINKLKETILQLAVMGKLVPQDPSDEPASVLLEKIAAEKEQLVKEGKLKKQKRLPLTKIDKNATDAPQNWEHEKFANLYAMEYGSGLKQSDRTNTGEFPVYGSNGVVGTHENATVFEPCIVIGRKGSAGALNLCLHEGCWVTDVAYSIVPPTLMNLNFSFIQIQSLRLDVLGKGIKPGLNRNEAYSLDIFVPPLAEQHRIVAKVDELMALCDQLKSSLQQAQEAQILLTDAVVENAL